MFDYGYALVIGVGAYQYLPHLDVPLTVADAQALAAVLRDPQYCGYLSDQITVLTDATATRDGILSAFDALGAHVDKQCTVLLFYSGHGHYGDDGTYYLTSHDTQLTENRKVLAGTAVSQRELLSKLQELQAERVLLILNACHAGEISPTLDGSEPFTGQSLPAQIAEALLATGTGRFIITACREHQYSFVGQGSLTIFGEALVDGLQGKGMRSQHGYISAFDLYTHLYDAVGAAVKREIPEAIRHHYNETQEPELTVLKGVGPFAVALYRGTSTVDVDALTAQPLIGPAVRQLSVDESQVAFQKIQSGGLNFGQQNTVQINGEVIGGDKIDTSGLQGAIIRPSAAVSQQNINTKSGDYIKGNLDQQQGVFISGGTITGSVVGVNSGTIMTNINTPHPGITNPLSLEQMLDHVQYRAARARQHGDEDLAEDIDGVASSLRAALRAQSDGKDERRVAKLDEARATMHRLAIRYSELQDIVQMLNSQLT